MPHSFYLLMHMSGLVLLTLSLGGLLMHRQMGAGDRPRILSVFHGVGLLLILVAGFGMLARLGINWPWPGWMYVKLVLFLVLGGFPALTKRVDAGKGWWIAIILILLAAWTGVMKPF